MNRNRILPAFWAAIGFFIAISVPLALGYTPGGGGGGGTPSVSSSQYWSPEFACTTTLSWDNGNAQAITLANAGQTFTFASGKAGARYVIRLTQPSSGAAGTVTWPGSVKWSGGSPPVLTITNSKVDFVSFYCDGTSYYGGASLSY